MDFMQSETMVNLARSFAGESQARNRYTLYAKQARKENQEYLARLFERTADNEKVHAEEFWEKLTQYAGKDIPNIGLDGGFPFSFGNTEENLKFAADGEHEEFTDAYPAFAQTAQEEGFADIAHLWKMIAGIEKQHHESFLQAHEELKNGTLHKKEQATPWRCSNCGYIHTALEAPETCPVCSKPKGWAMGYIKER
ncbi:MAG: rubrerythrin family protein [Oscillospiraceae bacterium]|jgi:rubrerythrin|nr:rubrerythrin family protein [Oscillospiraceae bacterium]